MAGKKKKKAAKKQKRRAESKKRTLVADPRVLHAVRKNLPVIPGMKKPKYAVLLDRMIKLDHDHAFKYCDLPIFEGERQITDPHVQLLYDRMKRGSFNPNLVVIAACEFAGVTYKINGQHTCWAIVNMPPSFSMRVREIKYAVTSEENLKSVYSMFDQNLARTEGHLTKVRLVNTDVTAGLRSSLINLLSSGLKYWLFEAKQDRSRHKDEEVAMLARLHKETFRNVGFMIQDNGDMIGNIKRQPVVAAMMATFDKMPRGAADFWQPTIDGLNLTDKNDPRWRLKKYLEDSGLGTSSRGSTRKPVSPEAMYRVCILAWSKWRREEESRGSLRPTIRRVRPI